MGIRLLCDPLLQNRKQVLFFINWVISFHLTPKSLLSLSHIWWYDVQFSEPFQQKFNVRNWLFKFTFYISIMINAEKKSWKCLIWSPKYLQISMQKYLFFMQCVSECQYRKNQYFKSISSCAPCHIKLSFVLGFQIFGNWMIQKWIA